MKVNKLINRFIPICDFTDTHPHGLSKEEQKEWIILDTFDMFSPQYDNPQKIKDVDLFFKQLEMKNVFGINIICGNNLKVAILKV